MKLEILKIELENFGSYEKEVLTFSQGCYLIVGKNGTGKSILTESIVWALFGKTTREDVRREGKHDAKVKIYFKIYNTEGVKTYLVDRVEGNDGGKLAVWCDDEDISSRKKTETQDKLDRLLGISYSSFTNILFIRQGMAGLLSMLTPVSRKSLIEEISMDSWDDLIKDLKKDLKTTEGELADAKEVLKTEERTLLQLTTTLDNKQKEYEYYLDKINNENAEERKQTSAELIRLRAEKSQAVAVADLRRLPAIRESLADVGSKYLNLKRLISEEKCTLCGHETQKERKAEAEIELAATEQLGKSLRLELNGLEEQSRKVNSIEEQIKFAEMKLSSLTPLVLEKPDVTELQKEIGDSDLRLAEITTAVFDKNFSIKNYQYLLEQLRPKSEFRSYIVGKIILILNSVVSDITQAVMVNSEIKLGIIEDGLEITFRRDGKEIPIKNLSGGERRRLDLILLLSFQKYLLLYSPLNLNIVVLDEIFDFLDAEGVEGFINIIPTLFGEEITLYIISHNEKLKDYLPNQIKINKEEGISKVG